MPEPESLSPPETEQPVVMIPMAAADVERRRQQRKLLVAAAVIGVALVGWFIYERTVNPVRAQQAYTDGVGLIRATRYEQAILNFDRAIELKPNFADAYRMRGRAYVATGKPDSAIQDFTRVAGYQPTEATVLVERGFAYLDKKDVARALADASRALQLNGKLGRAYNLLATTERALGNKEKALEDFSHAVELEPDLDNYFQRAATYQLLNRHKEAIADFDQALLLSPDQSHLYFARAESRAAVGDSAGAKQDITAGRNIDGF